MILYVQIIMSLITPRLNVFDYTLYHTNLTCNLKRIITITHFLTCFFLIKKSHKSFDTWYI